jgi:2-oxo-4-hydroxy-4-carboxy--5-ureidoimidazoline (OHCU) decarboxylase
VPDGPGLPSLETMNAMAADELARALAPLFEGAPGFLRRLASARPFESDAEIIGRAREIAREMPEAEQVELLDAHPRIGAEPASVSAMSYVEQGYATEAPGMAGRADAEEGSDEWERWEAAQPRDPWVADELAALNEAYESRFGFRFVVFVAGRPRSEIVPILERALHADRDEELRRGLDDVVHIAADRLATLRAT